MLDSILVGRGSEISEEPGDAMQRELEQSTRTPSPRLQFMTREHHLVRDAAVVELPKAGRPLSPDRIAAVTGLEATEVERLLDELQARLFFLVRNEQGWVHWAFPVTSDRTPHALTLSTGESLYAA